MEELTECPDCGSELLIEKSQDGEKYICTECDFEENKQKYEETEE